MKVNIYNKQATTPCLYWGFTGTVVIAMITVEKETSEMTLLPGGALFGKLSRIEFYHLC